MKKIIQRTLGIFLVSLTFVSSTFSSDPYFLFSDIDTTHPNYYAIQFLKDNGIVTGYNVDGKYFYKSHQKVSRAEALKVLLLAAKEEISAENSTFPDVTTKDWFHPFVTKAAKRQFVRGFGDGKFYPHANVTRAQFLQMASLAYAVPFPVELSDIATDQWYTPFMAFAQKYRVVNSYDEDPAENITRGEVAEIIYRLEQVKRKEYKKAYVYQGEGSASYYNEGFAGNATANGETYDPYDLTAAHRTLPFGTRLRVWHENRDNYVIVRINDRGPYHSSRVIDLSEKAFSNLAPISRGVIEVGFEVYNEDEEETLSIPDFISDEFSVEAQNIKIPDEVQAALGAQDRDNPDQYQDLFEGTVSYVSADFFDEMILSEPFPQKIVTGSVLRFTGRALEWGSKEITIFLQPTDYLDNRIEKPKQILFSGPVSGHNFDVPLVFDKPGKYTIGAVFDDDNRSNVANIEVTGQRPIRKFRDNPDHNFSADFSVNVVPETETVKLAWNDSNLNRMTKLVFDTPDGKYSQTLYVQDGLNSFELSYDFFRGFSEKGYENLLIEVFAAHSDNKRLDKQTENWTKRTNRNFVLLEGFRDTHLTEKISITPFARFPKPITTQFVRGTILSSNITLPDVAYWTLPDGTIREIPRKITGTHDFSLNLEPAGAGTHILEIISDEGEILFNRAMYFSNDIVLPVKPWSRVATRTTSAAGIRSWINRHRAKSGRGNVGADTALSGAAQKYAGQMATENFISHTSPTGLTFETRIKNAGLPAGEYGENLSFGSTLDLALSGLEDSASHYQNLLNPKWTKVGVGLAEGNDGYYVVQIFGQ